jgi:hypothetical protein
MERVQPGYGAGTARLWNRYSLGRDPVGRDSGAARRHDR